MTQSNTLRAIEYINAVCKASDSQLMLAIQTVLCKIANVSLLSYNGLNIEKISAYSNGGSYFDNLSINDLKAEMRVGFENSIHMALSDYMLRMFNTGTTKFVIAESYLDCCPTHDLNGRGNYPSTTVLDQKYNSIIDKCVSLNSLEAFIRESGSLFFVALCTSQTSDKSGLTFQDLAENATHLIVSVLDSEAYLICTFQNKQSN